MLNRKHTLIFILIVGIILTLAACSNGPETQAPTTAKSTKSSNYKAPDLPDDIEHEPPQGMGFDISNADIFEKGYYAVKYVFAYTSYFVPVNTSILSYFFYYVFNVNHFSIPSMSYNLSNLLSLSRSNLNPAASLNITTSPIFATFLAFGSS